MRSFCHKQRHFSENENFSVKILPCARFSAYPASFHRVVAHHRKVQLIRIQEQFYLHKKLSGLGDRSTFKKNHLFGGRGRTRGRSGLFLVQYYSDYCVLSGTEGIFNLSRHLLFGESLPGVKNFQRSKFSWISRMSSLSYDFLERPWDQLILAENRMPLTLIVRDLFKIKWKIWTFAGSGLGPLPGPGSEWNLYFRPGP